MTTHSVANAKLTFGGEFRTFEDSGKSGKAEIVQLETTDGLKAEVSIRDFGGGEFHVRLTEFLTTPAPPKYAHLNRNGTMTVQTRETDGKVVALIRALRPGGKPHETLNAVTFEELDALLGSDSKTWLEDLGFEVGTWEGLNPKAGRYKDSIAVAIEAKNVQLLALPWALTRVIALMKKLGKATVEVV